MHAHIIINIYEHIYINNYIMDQGVKLPGYTNEADKLYILFKQ